MCTHCLQFWKHNRFRFPPSFWWKDFIVIFLMMHSISLLGKESKNWFYIKHSIYFHVLVLLIKPVNCSETAGALWPIKYPPPPPVFKRLLYTKPYWMIKYSSSVRKCSKHLMYQEGIYQIILLSLVFLANCIVRNQWL